MRIENRGQTKHIKRYLAIALGSIGLLLVDYVAGIHQSSLNRTVNPVGSLQYADIVRAALFFVVIATGLILFRNKSKRVGRWPIYGAIICTVLVAVSVKASEYPPIGLQSAEQQRYFVLSNVLLSSASTVMRVAVLLQIFLSDGDYKHKAVLAWTYRIAQILAPNVYYVVYLIAIDKAVILTGILGGCSLFVSGILAAEKRDTLIVEDAEEHRSNKPKHPLRLLISNKFWVLFTLGTICLSMSSSFMSMSTVHYFSNYNEINNLSIFNTIRSASGLVGVLLVGVLIRKLDALKLVLAGRAIAVLGCIISLFFGSHSDAVLLVGVVLQSLGGGLDCIRISLIARISDYSEHIHGEPMVGLLTATHVASSMLGSMLAVPFTPSSQAGGLDYIFYLFLVFPCVLNAITLGLQYYFGSIDSYHDKASEVAD